MEPRGIKTKRILAALLAGRTLTPYDANRIGKTNEGTRIIRRLRETYPILDVQVAGELYHKYWMDEEYLKENKTNPLQVIWEYVKSLFD